MYFQEALGPVTVPSGDGSLGSLRLALPKGVRLALVLV